MDIRQFKLANHEEIVCEVVEWDTESDATVIIRKVLSLVSASDDKSGVKYYSFRPWAALQQDVNDLISLNADHIIAEVSPSEMLLEYYIEAIKTQSDYLSADEESEVYFDADSDKSMTTDQSGKKIFH